MLSELDQKVIFSIAVLLLSTTGMRFLIQELIAVVKLCKELKAEISQPLHPSAITASSIGADSNSRSELQR